MKKLGKIIAVTAAAACVTGAVAGLAACSGGSADIENTYIVSESAGNAYGGNDYTVYSLNIMDDGTYEMVKTTYVFAFSMNLGTYSYQTFGTYTAGTATDGYVPYTLSELAGGFDIHVDTQTATYPTELPAKEQGEQNMAQSADDVIAAYGTQMTVYVQEDGNILSLTNPNA